MAAIPFRLCPTAGALIALLALLPWLAIAEEAPGWTGAWQSYWRGGQALLELEQEGSEVSGVYQPGDGRIAGSVEDGVLYGEWAQKGSVGEFVFALSEDGDSFTGRFDTGEYWNGHRISGDPGRAAVIRDTSTPRASFKTIVFAADRTYHGDATAIRIWEPLLVYEGGERSERARRERRHLLWAIIQMSTFRLFDVPVSVPPGEEARFRIGPDGSPARYTVRMRRDQIGEWLLVVESEEQLVEVVDAFVRSLGFRSFREYRAAYGDSPRDTMRSFLGGVLAGTEAGIEQAIATFDLSYLPSHLRAVEGPILADYLHQIVNRAGLIVWPEIPNNPEMGVPYIHYRHPEGSVVVERVPGAEEGEPARWLFSADTLRSAPELFHAMQNLPVAPGVAVSEPITDFFALREGLRQISPRLVRRDLLLENWQWIALVGSVAVAAGLAVAAGWFGVALIRRGLVLMEADDPEDEARGFAWPLRLVVFALSVFLLFAEFGIAESGIAFAGRLTAILLVVGLGFLLYRLAGSLGGHFVRRAEKTPGHLDEIVTALATGLVRLVVMVATIVICADLLGIPYEGVITGLGIGGLALAFAARDTVSNMLSAAILLVDRPFKRGDLIEAGGRWATLEAVGLRSTRLRTFDDSLLIIPNAQLSDQAIVNWGKRRKRRVLLAIGLTYDTPRERIDAFVDGLREVYEAQPRSDRTSFYVGLKGFGASSIDIELWGYFNVYGYDAQVQAQHALIGDIVELARRLDVSFAFPTRTVHVIPPERTGALAQVAE